MSATEPSKTSGSGGGTSGALTTSANPIGASQQQLQQQPPPKTRLGILPSENIKEKQAKLKEERDLKRSSLDDRHYYIFQIVTDRLALEKNEVEDAALEGSQLDLVEAFFSENGSKNLLFYYGEPADTGSKIRINKSRVQIVDSSHLSFKGVCIFFVRNSTSTPITIQNISQEVFFGSYDCQNESILQAIGRQFSTLFYPVLSNMVDASWGKLAGKDGQMAKIEFLGKLSTFIAALEGAQESIDDRVMLKRSDKFDFAQVQTPADYTSVANNSESLAQIEELVKVWMKQIELVLAESEQIRREADNIGPRAELDYWKKRTSKFNYLLDQIKGHEVKSALGVLQAAKSRLLVKWRELDVKITDCANEARDNVKYLYTLERFCDPLYNSDPVTMLSDIPGLINAIRMIHSISRYYNTSERMTSLFLKVTNQMITACKSYVSEQGTQTIWSQPQPELIKKLKDCIRLNQEYQNCFQKTKEKLAQMQDERPFDFSEMYIFGKFDTFTRRCQKIIDVFDTIAIYSRLQESKIEGIEMLAAKFNGIVTTFKKKPYDFLDQRKLDFDNDYDDFKRAIQDLHTAIMNFIDNQFEKIQNTQRAIHTLRRFEKLDLPNLNIQDKYARILSHYSKDIEAVSKIYTKNRQQPPIARDLPPIAGKILWVRQLYRRISQPMSVFEANRIILNHPDARKIVKNYNQLSAVLIEYEVLHHRTWLRQVELVMSGVHASLVVKNADTNEYLVNFDPEIMTLIRETECMKRLKLEIPPEAEELVLRQELFKQHYNKLKFLIDENKRIRTSIPPTFEQLIIPRLQQLDQVLAPGCISLTWVSPNIDDYCESVQRALETFDLVLRRANDLIIYRIEAVLNDVTATHLCEINDEEPMSVEEFYKRTEELCTEASVQLQSKSLNVEEATEELIELLYPNYK